MGVPVALLSQGIGPMEDSALRRRAAEVLPRSALIAVREGLEGPQLLAELGVPPSRVAVTGDDALALVVDAPVVAGEALGVNVRRSDYAGVGDAAVARLGARLERLAPGSARPGSRCRSRCTPWRATRRPPARSSRARSSRRPRRPR